MAPRTRFAFVLLAAFLALAAAPAATTYKVDGRSVRIVTAPGGAEVSADCAAASWRCQALVRGKSASVKGLESYFAAGGANPGAVACRYQLKAKVVIGLDPWRNQQSFCRFPDGSLISASSLLAFVRLNDH